MEKTASPRSYLLKLGGSLIEVSCFLKMRDLSYVPGILILLNSSLLYSCLEEEVFIILCVLISIAPSNLSSMSL